MNGSVQMEQHLSFGSDATLLTGDVFDCSGASWICIGNRARASSVSVSERRCGMPAVLAPNENILPLSTYTVSPMMMARAIHKPDAKPLVWETSLDRVDMSVGDVPGQSDETEG
ncbi:hypothetical protein J3459_013582 [Metarhizium acridum]|uniref:uncharacterized protein n=1 Tax=Metarhizium acridum TaxID=92637 RepID=UPI001C6BA0CA|nr:hypothetical protein J3458_013257 [Metarhizium acridum]KAG8416860.1 hypothetical protein J3459_013582 [Metarhizium acridum]